MPASLLRLPRPRTRLWATCSVLVLIAAGATFPGVRPAQAAPPAGGPPLAYALNGNQIQVINARSNAPVASIGLPANASPVALAITPDARFVLVVQRSPSRVIAISVASNQIVGAGLSAGLSPVALAIDPAGATAYLLDNDDGRPGIIPIALHENGASIDLSAGATIGLPDLRTGNDLAVSPDGQSLLAVGSNVGNQGTLSMLPLAGGAPASIGVPSGASRIAVAPDASMAYLVVPVDPQGIPGHIERIGLAPLTDLGPTPGPGGDTNPVAETIATSPGGTATLWVADAANNLYQLPVPTPAEFQPSGTIGVFTAPVDLAALPDGASVEITTARRVVAHASLPNGPASSCNPLSTCPGGSGPIAITPDQRPVAAFAAVPAPPGAPTSFDASASTVAFGGIGQYQWSFGDGSSATTAGPTTTHTYAAAGPETVQLVETSAAGASVGAGPPSTVFTGHTMTRRGGPEAQTARTITILPPGATPSVPPSGSPPPPVTGTATLQLTPAVGPPGTVVQVVGAGFAKNAAVNLSWNAGIGSAVAATDGNGAFVQRILVFPRDRLGYRFLVTASPSLQASFLVEPLSIDPGGRDLLLFRR